MDKDSRLNIISSSYPYGIAETFLENEVEFLSKKFRQITIYPLYLDRPLRKLPDNVTFSDALINDHKNLSLRYKIYVFWIAFYFYMVEFLHFRNKISFLKHAKLHLSHVMQCAKKALSLEKEIKSTNNNFYSYWMNNGALILAILKMKKKIKAFIFRVHGYDLFEERHKDNYIPFRYICMKYCKNVYTVSACGQKYLKSKNIFQGKVQLSQLGTYDYGNNPFNKQDEFTIVSCSNMIKLKRVNMIVEILKHVKIPLKWVHFGTGNEYEMIEKQIKILPENITVKLKGGRPNNEIIQFYREHSVNLFIHLSESEGGVPVAIQEAASFGIPILATHVGGIPEIVNEETGILLRKNFCPRKTAAIINDFPYSKYNTFKFRKNVRSFWKQHFKAENNYEKFYREIVNIAYG